MLATRHVPSLLGLFVCSSAACGQQPADVAAADSALRSTTVTVERPRFDLDDPIGADRIAYAEEVRRKRAEGDPFQPHGIWLPPLYFTDAEHSIKWIGLIYLDLADFEDKTLTRLLAPFYLSMAGPEDRTVITPLFGSRQDLEGKAGYAGNYVWRRDRLADTDVVFPFFWSFRERDFEGGPDARTSGAIAPFVFWRRRTSGEHFTIGPPLFWQWGDAQESTTIAGPVFSKTTPGRSRFGALPFYLGGRDDDGSAFDACLPLLLFRKTEDERTTLYALQTFYRSDPRSHLLVSMPFVFSGREDDLTTTVIPPALFLHRADADTSSTFAVNTYYGSRPDGHTLASFPLFFSGRTDHESYTVVPPLLFGRVRDEAQGTSSTFAVNTFYRSRPDGHTLASFPLFFSGRTEDESYTVIPPLLFGRAADESAGTSSTFLLNTYYGARPDGHTLASFPLFFSGRVEDERYTVVPPLLFGRTSDESQGTSSTFAVNTYYRSRPDGHTLASVPLFFSGRKDDESYTVVPPLLFGRTSDESQGTSSTFAVNTYYRSRPDGHTLASVPLFFSGRKDDESYTVVPPLLFGRTSDESEGTSSTFAVNTYYRSRPDGHTLASVPLFFSGRKADESYTVVPPLLFGHTADESEGTSSTFLVNTYYSSRPDGYTLTSFPFAFARREGSHASMFVLPALTYHDTDGETSRTFAVNTYVRLTPDAWSFAFFPLVFAGGDATRSHAVGFPLLWRFADTESTTTIVAPFFHTSDADGAWHAGFAPLWFSGRFEDGDTYDVVPPLVWRFSGEDGTRLAVLPLFDYSRDATRTRVISPLMYHHADADGVHDATSKTVVLGLYWDFKDTERHTRVAFPLWWEHRDPTTGRGLSTFFPLYWRRYGEEETTNVLLNAAWTKRHDGSGWSFHLFPLFDLASDADDHFHWQVLGGLFGHERRGAKHRWRVGFGWTDPVDD